MASGCCRGCRSCLGPRRAACRCEGSWLAVSASNLLCIVARLPGLRWRRSFHHCDPRVEAARSCLLTRDCIPSTCLRSRDQSGERDSSCTAQPIIYWVVVPVPRQVAWRLPTGALCDQSRVWVPGYSRAVTDGLRADDPPQRGQRATCSLGAARGQRRAPSGRYGRACGRLSGHEVPGYTRERRQGLKRTRNRCKSRRTLDRTVPRVSHHIPPTPRPKAGHRRTVLVGARG